METEDDRSAQAQDRSVMTRYEELDRKAYSCISAAVRCEQRGNYPMRWLWESKASACMAHRDALTNAEAYAPAINPRMGKNAII
jgi:hypothetical protein